MPRYWLGVAISRWAGPQFPWATLAINVSGSFAIGLLTVLLSRWLPHPHMRLLVVVGFLGGYTTFSSFSAEALVLWERGERWLVRRLRGGERRGGAGRRGAGHDAGARADRVLGALVGASAGRSDASRADAATPERSEERRRRHDPDRVAAAADLR